MRTFLLCALVLGVACAADEQPFEATDASGHLMCQGFRTAKPLGTYVACGPWTYFYPDGLISAQGAFVDGVMDGDWTSYQDGGRSRIGSKNPLWQVVSYRNGEAFFVKIYNLNTGMVEFEGPVTGENREKVGRWSLFNDHGTMTATIDYDNAGHIIGRSGPMGGQ